MRARRLAVVLLLLVLPLGAAACGGGKKSSATTSTSSSPMDAVRAAAEKTAKSGSMQLALTAAATGSTNVAVAGAGGFDTTNHEGKLHLHFSTSGISSTLDVVLSGTNLYVSSPLFGLVLPAGKSWIKLDLTKGAKAGGVDLSSLLSQDPTQALDALQNVSSVVAVGTVKLGSIVATHYTATIKKASGSAKAAGVYNVWVGQDGYIDRLRTTIAATSGSTTGTVTATSNLSGFGQPVTVTVPPAAQTVTSTNGSIPGLGG